MSNILVKFAFWELTFLRSDCVGFDWLRVTFVLGFCMLGWVFFSISLIRSKHWIDEDTLIVVNMLK